MSLICVVIKMEFIMKFWYANSGFKLRVYWILHVLKLWLSMKIVERLRRRLYEKCMHNFSPLFVRNTLLIFQNILLSILWAYLIIITCCVYKNIYIVLVFLDCLVMVKFYKKKIRAMFLICYWFSIKVLGI